MSNKAIFRQLGQVSQSDSLSDAMPGVAALQPARFALGLSVVECG